MKLLDVDRASLTDLRVDPGAQPKARIQGMGLPGQNFGWFKLRNGQKALLFISDPTRVVKVPTKDGYLLMISIANGHQFIKSLQKAMTQGR